MSLIAFHRGLIAVGIVFCLGFGSRELMRTTDPTVDGSLPLGITFIALGLGLTVYLARLARFLGYEQAGDER